MRCPTRPMRRMPAMPTPLTACTRPTSYLLPLQRQRSHGSYPNPTIVARDVCPGPVPPARCPSSLARAHGSAPRTSPPPPAPPRRGGALSGSYPNPTLDVSGGACPNGKAVTDLSSQAALTCGPGSTATKTATSPSVPPVALAVRQRRQLCGRGRRPVSQHHQQRQLCPGPGSTAGRYDRCQQRGCRRHALLANTGGNSNSALRFSALFSNGNGLQNVALGDSALSSTPAHQNTSIGMNSMIQNTSGSRNVALASAPLLHHRQ